MSQQKMRNLTIAILATDGFEQSELLVPKEALEKTGAEVKIVSIHDGKIKGWNHKDWGQEISVDLQVGEASVDQFDGLVLPGGVINPDQLRIHDGAIQFIRDFAQAGKPIAAICHGPWTLIEAGIVHGKKMTSWPSLKTDLINAGAEWVDQEVVTDHGLVTSRKPNDLPAFCRKMIEEFQEGQHASMTDSTQMRGVREEGPRAVGSYH